MAPRAVATLLLLRPAGVLGCARVLRGAGILCRARIRAGGLRRLDFLDRENLLAPWRVVEVALDRHHTLEVLADLRVRIYGAFERALTAGLKSDREGLTFP